MYVWYLPQSKPNEVYAYQKLYQGKEPNEAQSQAIELMVVNEEPGLSDQSKNGLLQCKVILDFLNSRILN